MRLNKDFIQKTIKKVSFVNDYEPTKFVFSVDTRTIQKGEIFVALVGATTDGHNFLREAIQKGAAGIFIAEDKKDLLKKLNQSELKNIVVMTTHDQRKALLDLAAAWRAQFGYPVVGITGSVGKTSTKEIISTILTLHNMSHVASWRNQNTLLGVCLNILKMTSEHKAALFEMGISHRGQMAELASLVKPTLALITQIGHCHMEGLGSINDIAAEKRDIFKFFEAKNIGIINGDDPLLAHVGYKHPVIKFGLKTTNQIQARKVNVTGKRTEFVLKLYGTKYRVALPNSHSGAIFNALAATAVANHLKVPAHTIIKAIEMPLAITGRFTECPLKLGKGVVIDDTYNANPESMKAALMALERIGTKAQKIVVLGDMLELGVNSAFWHRQIGRFLRKTPSLRNVILVGSLVKWTKKTLPLGLKVEHVLTWEDAQAVLKQELGKETVVLVKGSSGTNLKHLVEMLT